MQEMLTFSQSSFCPNPRHSRWSQTHVSHRPAVLGCSSHICSTQVSYEDKCIIQWRAMFGKAQTFLWILHIQQPLVLCLLPFPDNTSLPHPEHHSMTFSVEWEIMALLARSDDSNISSRRYPGHQCNDPSKLCNRQSGGNDKEGIDTRKLSKHWTMEFKERDVCSESIHQSSWHVWFSRGNIRVDEDANSRLSFSTGPRVVLSVVDASGQLDNS